MKKSYIFSQICLVLFSIVLVTSCKGQSHTNNNKAIKDVPKEEDTQIGEYVVCVFEDTKGNLWFATLEKGVAMYNRKSLRYFTTDDGLPSNRVSNIVEDQQGNLWFGTGLGISKYDGETFTNFTESDGLRDNRVSNLLLDKTGKLWVGTWGGVCKFDGSTFTNVSIPIPKINTPLNKDTKDWTTEIFEDSKGNVWFARDGYGACVYNGSAFTHFTKTDGLASNNVQAIQEDAQGNIWFGSRVAEKDHPDPKKRQGSGGLVKYDGKNFIPFPNLEGLHHNDVYQIHRDSKENLWISTTSNGIYKYDGDNFTNYPVVDPVTKNRKLL